MPDYTTEPFVGFDYMLNKCWKDSPNIGRCSKSVDRYGLGLCAEYYEELREEEPA